MSPLLTATCPAWDRIMARARATAGTRTQASMSLNRKSKMNNARRETRKSRHADRTTWKAVRDSLAIVCMPKSVSVKADHLSQHAGNYHRAQQVHLAHSKA